MRTSKFFFRTFKEAPHEADTISHQLLERGGYLRRLYKGIFSYSPLMLRVLNKLMALIREELNAAGAQEISMPLLHPAELWEKTGRWKDFISADLLYNLKDREGHPFCLAPTHEEVVVSYVAAWVTSYKQLPLNLYQIGTKFRDEIRPRFGLIRGKEFIMKDGYSFSTRPEGMEEQYLLMRHAYCRIFTRLGLDFVIVQAHGGKIGKGKSEEFQVRASIGEDAVMVCGDYAANVEMTQSIPPSFSYSSTLKNSEKVATPRLFSIQDLSGLLKIAPQEILKTLIYKCIYADREEYVALGIRGDRQINEVKIADHFQAIEVVLASEEEVRKVTGCRIGFAGPLHSPLPFFADKTAEGMTNFCCAGNEEDLHWIQMNWGRDLPQPLFFDFLLAEPGDGCPHVPGGVYHLQKGIEVGHVFNLGTRYTEQLGASFQDEQGKSHPMWMGTYGLGVGRTVAACIEQRHDEKGIIWPLILAPFRILVTPAIAKERVQMENSEKAYLALEKAGFEPLFDDREERLGFKLKDSDLIGIPYKLIVGKAFMESGQYEIESRTGEKILVDQKELLTWAAHHLRIV